MTQDEYMDILQENIIYFLDKGVNPWQSPWVIAKNGESKRDYHGINAPFLTMIANRYYDGDPRFYTYEQAAKAGYHVRKGERGYPVSFFKTKAIYRYETDENGERKLDEDGNPIRVLDRVIPIPRYFIVFNAKQMRNIPEYDPEEFRKEEFDKEEAEKIINDSPCAIFHDQLASAFYTSGSDSIHLPPYERFRGDGEYYSTLFHEMTHSTGNAFRLSRDSMKYYHYRDDWRAKEELIAEIGSVLLCDRVGLKYQNPNSAAYIKSWAAVLKRETGEESDFRKLYSSVTKAVHYLIAPEDRVRMHLQAHNQEALEILDSDSAIIEIQFTESSSLQKFLDEEYGGNFLSFQAANSLFGQLNDEGKYGLGYDKTDFRLQCVIKGAEITYSGRYDIGSEDGDLLTHIAEFAKAHPEVADNPETQKLNDIVLPYLQTLIRNTQKTGEDISALMKDGIGEPVAVIAPETNKQTIQAKAAGNENDRSIFTASDITDAEKANHAYRRRR